MHIDPQLHWHNLDGTIDWLGTGGSGGGSTTTSPAPKSTGGIVLDEGPTSNQRVTEFVKDGLVWYQPIDAEGRPNGEPYTLGEQARAGGGGSSFNPSELGPEAIRIREAELAQDALLKQQQLDQQRTAAAAELQLSWAQLQQQITASDQRLVLEQQNLQFLRDKLAIESQANDATALRETQTLIEQITSRMERTQTERAGLTQQAQMLQAQMQYEAQVENARNQMEADKTNEARRQFNLTQRRGVATDIANFAKDPGDVGANAAYLQAGGAAPISQAMAAGKDARTQQSLLPLGLLLNTQDELGRGPALLNAQQVSAPNVPLPSFGTTTPPTAASLGLAPPTGMLGGFPRVPVPLPPLLQAPKPALAAPPASVGTSSPSYLSPQGDPWSPAAQARYASGLAEGSIVEAPPDPSQYGAIAENAANLFTPDAGGQDFTFRVDENGTLVAIPAMARGGSSNAPISLVGERGPELLVNHEEMPGGRTDGFSVIPNDALPPGMGGVPSQGTNPFLGLPSLPQQASPSAVQNRPQMQPNPMTMIAMKQRGLLNAMPVDDAPIEATRQWPEWQNTIFNPDAGGGFPAYVAGTPDWQALMSNANLAAPYERSLGFLNSAFQQALGQSPWAQSGTPTPVALSAPGTNPFLAEYAAALAATGSGIKPGLFQYEREQWKPQALSPQTITRRTR